MEYDEELEAIKRRKLEEYRRRILEAQRAEQERKLIEARKRQILRAILTPKARMRLETVRMVRPEVVEQIEAQLIQLAMAGRIREPITEEQIKVLLRAWQSNRREIRIVRR